MTKPTRPVASAGLWREERKSFQRWSSIQEDVAAPRPFVLWPCSGASTSQRNQLHPRLLRSTFPRRAARVFIVWEARGRAAERCRKGKATPLTATASGERQSAVQDWISEPLGRTLLDGAQLLVLLIWKNIFPRRTKWICACFF